MNKKRQRQIEDISLNILRRFNCYPSDIIEGEFSAEVDVHSLAQRLGIVLVEYDFGDDVSGVLLRDGEDVKIGYAKSNGFKRQRFTIAHELGHYVLNHQRQGVFVDTPEKYFTLFRDSNSSTGEDLQEREANAFAAALLMPRELVIEAATKIYNSGITRNEEYDLIEALAEDFNVSKLAMSIRLTNLDMVW